MKAFKTSQGKWLVNFSEHNTQKTLYLGIDFTAGSADRVAKIVTDILACRKRGDSLPLELFRKIELLPARVRSSLERHGLIGGIAVLSLHELLERFYASKTHLKQNTQVSYKIMGNQLTAFFGKDCRIDSIHKLDCDHFKTQRLAKQAACTVSRNLRRARSIFKLAVDAGWLQHNPFKEVSSNAEVNLSRQCYIDCETVHTILPHCRDDHDRLLLALARFGGLRIPSEIQLLRFSDFTNGIIRIHSDTKTGAREVPLFGEIKEIFDRIVAAIDGENLPGNKPGEFIFGKLGNFRDRILAAIRTSGMEPWEKLFINLRSSCITDMAERGYSEKCLDAMFGNSALVRSRHYIQFRQDKEYAKVLQEDETLRKISLEKAVKIDIESLGEEALLVLRDLLLNRFGTGKQAG